MRRNLIKVGVVGTQVCRVLQISFRFESCQLFWSASAAAAVAAVLFEPVTWLWMLQNRTVIPFHHYSSHTHAGMLVAVRELKN